MTEISRLPSAFPMNRRSFGRRTVCKPAVIIPEYGNQLTCTVVDQSEAGVGLRTAEIGSVPDLFVLLIECDDLVVSCQVAHRTNGVIGVKFLHTPRKASRMGTPGALRAKQFVQGVLGPHRNNR